MVVHTLLVPVPLSVVLSVGLDVAASRTAAALALPMPVPALAAVVPIAPVLEGGLHGGISSRRADCARCFRASG